MKETVVASAKWLKESWLTNRSFAIWTISVVAVLIRVVLSFALKTYQFSPQRDYWSFGFEWGRIAAWLVETGLFSLDGTRPTADTDPLYIFLIAPFFYVFGTFSTSAAIALIALQSVVCGLTVWAVFVLADEVFGSLEARLSALLFAFYPASVFFAVSRIAPSSLAVFLLCLVFLAARRLPSSRGLFTSLSIGVLIGLVVLTSSDNLSLFLVIPLWLLLVGGQPGRMFLKISIIIIAAVIVMLPWSLRNSSVSGEATISKANLGYHLYVGNNPHATGFFYTSLPPELSDFASPPYRQSEYYAMAFSWIGQHPAEFLKLTLTRIQYFWFVIDGRGHSRKQLFQGWLLLTMAAFAIFGGVFRRSGSSGVKLLWLFVAIYPLVFYFTHASFYRHRYHLEPFVLILASNGLMYLWALLSSKRQNTAVRPVDLSMSEGS